MFTRHRSAFVWMLSLALGAGSSATAHAHFCSADAVPAATLLLPYFEVDLDSPNGITTLFSVNNALATATVAHLTLWTDWGIPTLNFDIYLTGYDVQTFNLRDVFNGYLPRTASAGQDPTDQVSPKGVLSQDLNIASCTQFPYSSPTLPALLVTEMRLAHSGGNAAVVFHGCASENLGDSRVRGYVTVDATRACSLDYPGAPGYFENVATRENRLWGTVTYVDPAQNSAQQESLVHIEACDPAAGDCPTGPGSYTFYGRYLNFDGSDDREPLATTFAASFLNGGAFDGGTSLLVWRDTKRGYSGIDGPAACSLHRRPSWYPLHERDVVAFDEQESPVDLCSQGDVVIPVPGTPGCFPLATQKVSVDGTATVGDSLTPPFSFGWLRLDLDHGPTFAGEGQPGRAQAWVTVISVANGRFSTGVDAVHLDSACTATPPPVVLP